MTIGGWPRRSWTVRGRQKSPAPHRSSAHLVGLAHNRDPLSSHLILYNSRRIAVGGNVLPDGNHLFRCSAVVHARGRRERHGPELIAALHRDRGGAGLGLLCNKRTVADDMYFT